MENQPFSEKVPAFSRSTLFKVFVVLVVLWI